MEKRSFRLKREWTVWVMGILCGVAGIAAAEAPSYTYTPEGRRDPFIPLVSASGYLMSVEEDEKSTLRLEGIMFDPRGESMAIINGELRKVGEKIGDAVISRIEPNRIVVIKDNENVEMELRREE